VADAAAAAPRERRRGAGGIQKKFWQVLDRIAAEQPAAERLEIWFLDEARVGQKGRMTRRWFLRGQRPRMVKDLRYRSAYIFGAVCPERDTGVALVLPEVSTTGMNLLLQEIASQMPERRHAVVLIDNTGWHVIDRIEVFADEAAIVEACCNAWNRLIKETGRTRSLADRPWIHPVSP
jgi:DDE superfamily endonuclease